MASAIGGGVAGYLVIAGVAELTHRSVVLVAVALVTSGAALWFALRRPAATAAAMGFGLVALVLAFLNELLVS